VFFNVFCCFFFYFFPNKFISWRIIFFFDHLWSSQRFL
jgi:hypothetical protein